MKIIDMQNRTHNKRFTEKQIVQMILITNINQVLGNYLLKINNYGTALPT